MADSNLPSLVVFDLDACLWDKEMYEVLSLVLFFLHLPIIYNIQLDDLPSRCEIGPLRKMGMGVVAVFSGQNRIALHPGALRALQEIHLLQLGKNVRCAAV